jgi:acyl-CoA reductase-like NAD-dependent aldehyde dehydrogenase
MPTVVRARPKDRVCQEEVFGPFVTVTTFKDEDEAVGVANDSVYGLGGGLWTSNLSRAHRVARQIITGMVWINCYKRANPGSPFGGVRSSGYGRDLGIESIEEYTTRNRYGSTWTRSFRRTTGVDVLGADCCARRAGRRECA